MPSRALARSRAAAATEIQSSLALGRLPLLSLSSAVGLALIMVAYSNSRAGVGNPEWLFWLGLLVIVVPIGLRLLSNQPVRPERLGLVVLLGLTLYLVKVIHSPYAFTFSDELVHLRNAEAVVSSGALFNDNTVLPVTPLYPGLSTVSAALASLTGLSTFVVGLVIIGSTRLIAILALFLFYEQIGQSSRVAGLATLIYAANANFLFWSAQYAYESLALPLAIMVLYVVARRERETNPRRQLALTVVAFVGILVVTMAATVTYGILKLRTMQAAYDARCPVKKDKDKKKEKEDKEVEA